MARGIQPFATEFDGDVLYAVSTAELPKPAATPATTSADIGILASELMWDAVLASVLDQPASRSPSTKLRLQAADLERYVGEYEFSDQVRVRITAADGKLLAQATGARDAQSIRRGAPVQLLPAGTDEFTVPGRYPFVLHFASTGRLIVNPGHWQQIGTRQ